MNGSSNKDSEKKLGHEVPKKAPTDPASVKVIYDDLAENYDETLATWQYQCPNVMAKSLSSMRDVKAQILDAGCGTGLTGRALSKKGFYNITGIDLSNKSLLGAQRSNCYSQILEHDLTQTLPFEAERFDIVVCVGVFSYIEDTERLLREFLRVTKTGGLIGFTQRDDLYLERENEALFDRFHSEKLFTWQLDTSPQSYLPGHPDFSQDIKVKYMIWEKA